MLIALLAQELLSKSANVFVMLTKFSRNTDLTRQNPEQDIELQVCSVNMTNKLTSELS